MPIQVQAPTGDIVEFPDGTPTATMEAAMLEAFPPPPEPPAYQTPTMGSQFATGFKESSGQLGALITEGLPGQVQALLGNKEAATQHFEEYMAKTKKIAEKYPELSQTAPDVGALKKAALYTARTLGTVIPSQAASLAGGAAGFVGTGGNPLGAAAGYTAASMALNSPETFVGLLENSDIEDPTKAAQVGLGVGAVKTGLDFIPVHRLFGETFGEIGKLASTKALFTKAGMKSAAAVVGRQMRETAIAEGITEGAQEALDIEAERLFSNAPKEFFGKENVLRMAQASFAGSLGGTFGGGIGGVIQVGRAHNLGKDDKDDTDISDILREEISDNEVTPLETLVKDPQEARSILSDVGHTPEFTASLSDPDAIKGANLEISKPLKAVAVPNVTQALETIQQTGGKATGTFSTYTVPEEIAPVTPTAPKKGVQVKFKGEPFKVTRIDPKDGRLTLQDVTNPSRQRFGVHPNKVEVTPTVRKPKNKKPQEFVYNIPATPPVVSKETLGSLVFSPSAQKAEVPNVPLDNAVLESIKTTEDAQAVADVVKQPARRKKQKGLTRELFDADVPLAPPEKLAKPSKTPVQKKPYKRGDIVYVGPDAYKVAWFDPITNDIHATGTGKNKITMKFPADFASDKPKLQRLGWKYRDILSSPVYRKGDLWDYTDGILRGLEITKVTPKLQQIEDIVKTLTKGTATARFFSELRAFNKNKTSDPIRGAQIGNVVAVSLGLNENIVETALHETWHFLYDERMGMFTDQERAIIEKNFPHVVSALEKTYGVDTKDLLDGYSSEEGRSELLASLFGLYAKDNLSKMQKASIPSGLRGFFTRALNFLKALKKGFNQTGYSQVTDIFDKVLEGDVTIAKQLSDTTHALRTARLQNLGETVRETAKENLNGESWQENLKEMLDSGQDLKGLTFYTKYLSTASAQATNNVFMAAAVEYADSQDKMQSELLTDFSDAGKVFLQEKNVKVKNYAANILDELRLSDQAVKLDEQGKLTFTRGDKKVTLKPYVSSLIKNLDEMMKAPLRVWFTEAQTLLRKHMGDIVDKTGPTIRKHYKENTMNLSEEAHAEIADLVEATATMEEMLKKAYIHHGRVGPWAMTVHLNSNKNPDGTFKKDAVPVFHAHFEEGKHLNKVNKFQYETSQQELEAVLKSKGLTKADVTISGLYKLTSSSMFKQLQNSANTLEILNSLLGSAATTEEYVNLRKEFADKIATKGFMRVLSPSKEIQGYSKDWERVIPNYINASSINIAAQKFKPKFDFLSKQLDHLGSTKEGTFLRKNVQDYIEYVNDGSAAYAKFSTFNYMMTMGGNVSTALLQVLGLPTFTVAAMTQYHPSFLQNQGRVMKNLYQISKILYKDPETTVWSKGAFLVRFDNTTFQKDLNLSENAKAYVTQMYRTGLSGGLLVEESLNRRGKETRTASGKADEAWTVVKNLSGSLMSYAEQLTRMTTALSTFQMFEDNPEALDRADRLLQHDQSYVAARKLNPDQPLIFAVTNHTINSVHAQFGKVGRGPSYRGFVGRVMLPFNQYPAAINELMMNMAFKRGVEGQKAFAYLLGSMAITGGLLGLPAAELGKELVELAIKFFAQKDVDLEHQFRKVMQEATGTDQIGVSMTQGLPRLLGLSISARVRPAFPGQDLALTVLGAKGGDVMGSLGVGSSTVVNALQAIQEAREGTSLPMVASMLSPASISNLIKSVASGHEGIKTRKGDVTLVPADEVTSWMVAARSLGFTAAREASARELQYFAKLEEGKYKPTFDAYRARGKTYLSNMIRERNKGNTKKADEWYQEMVELTKEVSDTLVKERLPASMMGAFQKSVFEAQFQLKEGGINFKNIDKKNRLDLYKQQEAMLGK